MTHLKAQQLSSLYRDISALCYEHPEGGAYVYVRFLSLLRHLPGLVAGRADLEYIAVLQDKMNASLESRFTQREEEFFRLSRSRVLLMLRNYLAILEPLSAGITAL